jgi:hypothetical protein
VPNTPKTPSTDWYSRPLKRWTDANVNFAVRLAEFARKGYADFGQRVTEDNVARLDGSNGLYRGMISAWGQALDELPDIAARYYDDLLRASPPVPVPQTPARPARSRARPKASRSSRRGPK